uniref:Uncharacterized protein n=1 Tax=Cacopsylla melanoneura TaxID=428564 RepID=A0A8D9BM93_9HEMI
MNPALKRFRAGSFEGSRASVNLKSLGETYHLGPNCETGITLFSVGFQIKFSLIFRPFFFSLFDSKLSFTNSFSFTIKLLTDIVTIVFIKRGKFERGRKQTEETQFKNQPLLNTVIIVILF